MHRLSLLSITLITLTFVGSACDSRPDVDETSDDTATLTTWHKDVAPIVYEKCVGCHHSDGGIAPFALETFEEAGPLASFMLEKIEDGEMPPWGAREGESCAPEHDWKNDARLSDEQLAVMQAWVQDGAPEGDPTQAVPVTSPPEKLLQGVTHDLSMPAYTTSGFEDELRCFVLDPQLTSTQYMTGVEVTPSNLEVAHHATLTVVPAAGAQAIRDQEEGNTGFLCTGGLGIPGAYSLGGWVPGSDPFETPAGSGTPIDPGSIIVLQMHYHPTGLDHDPDQTHLKLRMTSEKPPKTFLFQLLGNAGKAPILQPGADDNGVPRFFIPANVDNHSEVMEFKINTPGLDGRRLPIVAIGPHMHYVGQSMEVSIHRGAPEAAESTDECLVNVNRWDFDWQRFYSYDAPIDELSTVTNGDTIRLRCTYNNTVTNRFVQRMLTEEGLANPVDVVLGDETTDEMCIAAIGVVF